MKRWKNLQWQLSYTPEKNLSGKISRKAFHTFNAWAGWACVTWPPEFEELSLTPETQTLPTPEEHAIHNILTFLSKLSLFRVAQKKEFFQIVGFRKIKLAPLIGFPRLTASADVFWVSFDIVLANFNTFHAFNTWRTSNHPYQMKGPKLASFQIVLNNFDTLKHVTQNPTTNHHYWHRTSIRIHIPVRRQSPGRWE